MAIELDISTVRAQQQFKSLKQEIGVLFQRMQMLNKEFKKQQQVGKSLSGMLSGQLTPAEKRVAAVSKQAEAAFVRQAKATNAARQKVLNLTQALKLSGATQQKQAFILRNVNQSLVAFDRKMSKGVRTARQFQEAQDRLNRSLGGANRSLKVITDTQKKNEKAAKIAARSGERLSANLRNIGSSAVFAVGPLSGIGARVTALGAIATRTGIKIALLAAGMVALGVGLFKIVKNSLVATLAFQKMESSLVVATGSLIGARDAFKFVSDISLTLGLSLEQAGDQFAQLSAAAKGTSLEGEGIRNLFSATAKASVALGLSVDQTTGIFRAFQQIISKGTVQSEELRGQLGERLPGAFQLAAIAMGVTTKALGKMLEQGEVLADDLLPKLAAEFEKRFSKQAVKASKNLQASLNRLSTTTFLFSVRLGEVINSGQIASGILNSLASFVKKLTSNVTTLVAVLGAAGAALTALALPGILAGLAKLAAGIRFLSATVLGLSAALIATPIGLVLFFARLAAAVGVSVIGFNLLKTGLEDTTDKQEELVSAMRTYIDLVKEAEGATEASVKAQIAIVERSIKARLLEIEVLKKSQSIKDALARIPVPAGQLFASQARRTKGRMRGRVLGAITPETATGQLGNIGRARFVKAPATDASRIAALINKVTELRNIVVELGELQIEDLVAANAVQDIVDLKMALEDAKRVRDALAKGDLIGARRIPAEAEARKIVKDIPVADLQSTLEGLGLPEIELSDLSEKFTREGRELIKVVGGVASEITVTISDLKGSLGKFVNIPTIFEGEIVSLEKAKERIEKAGGIDPDTGRTLQTFDTLEEALASAELRTKALSKEMEGLFAGPRSDAIIQSLAETIDEVNRLDKANKKADKSLAAVPKAVKDLNNQVANLNAQSLALRSGPEAIREFEAELRKQKALKNYTKATKDLGKANLDLVPTFKEFQDAIEGVRLDKMTAKINEQIAATENSNDVLRLRIAGLKEEANILEIRNKLEAEFGEDVAEAKLKRLETELSINKRLTAEFKEQQEAEKELARLSKDFSKVIGTAFEDAIIKGDDFRSVLKGIVDDINRIILRATVTKPFEKFLTDTLSSGNLLESLFGSSSPSGPGPGAGPPLRFAHGGRPSAKKISIVGEEGPELFVPDVPGTIVPIRPGAAGQEQAPDPNSAGTVDTLGGLLGAIGGFAVPGPGMFMTLAKAVTNQISAANAGSASIGGFSQPGRGPNTRGAGFGGFGPGRGPDTRGGRGGGGTDSGGAGPGAGPGSSGGAGDSGEGSGAGPGAGPGSEGAGFAHGGRPPVGRRALVGEQGPELFVPDSFSSSGGGGGNTVVSINQRFDFRGASIEAVALLRRESKRIRDETIAEISRRRTRGITAARR